MNIKGQANTDIEKEKKKKKFKKKEKRKDQRQSNSIRNTLIKLKHIGGKKVDENTGFQEVKNNSTLICEQRCS